MHPLTHALTDPTSRAPGCASTAGAKNIKILIRFDSCLIKIVYPSCFLPQDCQSAVFCLKIMSRSRNSYQTSNVQFIKLAARLDFHFNNIHFKIFINMGVASGF